jgi:hypothetical protein
MPEPARRWPSLLFALLLAVVASQTLADGAESLTWADAKARLNVANQIAREKNDRQLVERVASTAKRVKAELDAKNSAEAERLLREIESATGIDPGGWSMGGLKIFHPTPEFLSRRNDQSRALDAAMAKGDLDEVHGVIADMRKTLGDQVGLPDLRTKPERAQPHPLSQAEAVDLFLKALKSQEKSLREIEAGRTVGDYKLRYYAGVVQACCDVRPAIQRHRPEQVADVDKLVSGACSILTRLQEPDGHFPFPDLRGKSIRFGEMVDRAVAKDPNAVKDGWLITPDPDGGTQFDTGLCGVALLTAGATYHDDRYTKAGLRAADWALTQPCVKNFNYNAFSVSLLMNAYRVAREERYLAAALQKFRLGIAPGQVENGRWIDPHNARTVYHLIILRALHDLWEGLPADQTGARAEVAQAATKAMAALLDEFERAGITALGPGELLRHERLNPNPDKRLRPMIELTKSVIYEKCVRGDQVKMGVPITDMAALVR